MAKATTTVRAPRRYFYEGSIRSPKVAPPKFNGKKFKREEVKQAAYGSEWQSVARETLEAYRERYPEEDGYLELEGYVRKQGDLFYAYRRQAYYA